MHEGSPTGSKSRTPSVKSCLKYEILCCYRDSDSILDRSGTIAYTQLLLHLVLRSKNEIRCSAPLRICNNQVVEAAQNQELWERSRTKPGDL